MIRVYAFVHDAARLPEVAGVAGAPIEQHGRGVTAVVSRHERSAAAGDPRRDALAHGLVVEALAAVNDAVLPVRFGETFADDRGLDAVLQDRDFEIRVALARVGGCVELGVRVAGAAPQSTAAATSGRGYMETRLARLAERDAVVHGLHEELDALARDAVRSERGGFEGAYLVERPRIEAAHEAVRRFTAANPELTVLCTGPWAPYSFGGTRA